MSEVIKTVFRGDGEYAELIQAVFEQSGAGRVTLRLPADDVLYPVYVEVRREDAVSAGDYAADPNTGTWQYLNRELRPLVQNDCANVADEPPTVLRTVFGVGAQVLVPITLDGEFRGVISVHHVGGAREWKPEEIAVAKEAAAQIAQSLA
jgi:GAF domain-containing protein